MYDGASPETEHNCGVRNKFKQLRLKDYIKKCQFSLPKGLPALARLTLVTRQ